MKKNVLKGVPELKSENGTLKGGFSSISLEQARMLKGGRGNHQCNNSRNCTLGSHTQCTNTGQCFTDSTLEP